MSTAQERLQSGYYNSAAVSGANPGGLASGGHVPNFPAALQDMGVVAQDIGAKAAAGVAAAQSAGQSAAAAAQDRVLAQQAAQAAGQFDPSTKVDRAGDRITGVLGVGQTHGYNVVIKPVVGGEYGATLEFYAGSARTHYIGGATSQNIFMNADGGRAWSFQGAVYIGGYAPFTQANDGSGSGLDADMVRGMAPSFAGAASSVATRNGAGECGFKSVYLASAGGVLFDGGGNLTKRDANTLQMDKGLYLTGPMSASVVTERSDRRLKSDIAPLEAVEGRLRPVRYVLNETGETKIGFIAQDIEEIRPEAVIEGALPDDAEEGASAPLEVAHMALIAHLARQVNDLQDRLDKAGL